MSTVPREAPRASRFPFLSPWLTWFQIGASFLILVTLCRGEGLPVLWGVYLLLASMLQLLLFAERRHALGQWLAEMWQQLERYPQGPIPWRALLLLSLPFVAILALQTDAFISGDTEPTALTATSIVRQRNLELSEFIPQYAQSRYHLPGGLPYFIQRTRKGNHSSYPLGMTVFAVPTFGLAQATGANLDSLQVRSQLERWTASLVAATSLCMFLLLALHRVPVIPALVMTIILGTGSAMYSTVAQALWQHGGVIFCSLLILLLEFRQGERPSYRLTVWQGVACATMLACRSSAMLFVVTLGMWVLLRSPRRALWLTAVAIIVFLPWMWLNYSIYHNIRGGLASTPPSDYWASNYQESVPGILLSPGRGLLVYQPWILFGLFALVPGFRGQPEQARSVCPAGWQFFGLAVIVLHVSMVSTWRCWSGGCCWGSRLLSEIVPLCAFLLLGPVAALWKIHWGKGVIVSVGLLALLLHLPAMHLGAPYWHARYWRGDSNAPLWSWKHAPFMYPLEQVR